jgi:putative aldouronate transport system permease protein
VKRRIVIGILMVLMVCGLMMPFYSVYPHMSLSKDVAAAFPATISGFTLIGQGNGVFPVSLMPALKSLDFRGSLLVIGLALTLLSGVLCMFFRRGISHAAALLGGAGTILLLLFAFYTQQLDKSLLYDVMLTVQWYVWGIFILSLFLFGMELWLLKEVEPLPLGDRGWRLTSAVLCIAALCMLLLPFIVVQVPNGTFSAPVEDALASRSLTGWQWLKAQEPQLQKIGAENSVFADPASGGSLKSLVTLSDSGKNLKNLFMIPTNNGSVRMMAAAACLLLFIGLLLQLVKKVDRWIPACVISLSAVMLLSEAVGALVVDGQYQFLGAAYQMMFMGFGGYTPALLFMAAMASCAASSAVMGIRRANEPYFVNPIPQKKRLLTVSIFLASASALLLLMPIFQVNLYSPGKINQANPAVSRPMSGLELVTFQKPDLLLSPVNTRGKLLYGAEPANNGLTADDLRSLVSGALNKMGAVTLGALLITLTGLALLFGKRRNKRTILAALLSGGVVQALAVVLTLSALPREIGFLSALGPLYISMGTTAFAAFFTGFIDQQELPKKYKLFLMMLPFLVAVLLFSYLPLSGWRYAFYNYKLGLPMDQQEYVGFKWFTALFSSPAQQGEIMRVMRNTFAMSGIGLATSWMPVAFAIFLTEVRTRWFKKFVQIFTTLPNFISWVLVFSFALTIFSLDTGIVNKVLIQLGLIKEPIAYLNSSEHIWLKMWMWNTWKALGWGAIMYLAAIAGIDQELYDAAKVDCAGRWRQIYHITIPGLLPTFFVLLLLSVSNIVNNGMEQYLVFQNAMNKSTIEVLDLHVFNISLGARSSDTISLATAIGILKSLISVVMLFLANSFSKLVRGESIV